MNIIALFVAFIAQLTLSTPAYAMFSGGHCGTACRSARNAAMVSWPTHIFSILLFFAAAYYLGKLVQKDQWLVGDTRKILAITLYLSPVLTGYWWTRGLTTLDMSVAALIFVACILLLSKPFRKRWSLFDTAFSAINRPEDHPYTIVWLVTSVVAMWLVIIGWIQFLPTNYLLVALFVSGVGDALAEPVGLRFGRHQYETRAIGTNKRFVRTLEGSAVVFASAVIGVVIFAYPYNGISALSGNQFFWSLILFPVATTLAEAKSPHTWDQPLIVLSCAIVTYIVMQVPIL